MFGDVIIGSEPLILSPTGEVDAAETELGIRFPTGYKEYVTRLGEEVLCGYLRIYPPRRILSGDNNVAEWRGRINDYWFWDRGQDVLTKSQALQSVVIGDTVRDDELIVSPGKPERVYVLPYDSGDILVAGEGLAAAVEWLCRGFPEYRFEPLDSRRPDAEPGAAADRGRM